MIYPDPNCPEVVEANKKLTIQTKGMTESFPIPDRESHEWFKKHFRRCTNCQQVTTKKLGCGVPIW